MDIDTLIFCDGIIEPPSESLALRGLCLYLDAFGNSPAFLLETERDTVDLYYNWLKRIGMHDFIDKKKPLQESIEYGLESISKISGDYFLFDGSDSTS